MSEVRPGLLLLGILLVAANLRAGITTVGPLAEDVSRELALTPTQVSLLITLPVVLFAVLSPLAPPVARKIGIRESLALALALLAVSIVLRSLPWWPALWLGTAGLGMAIAFMNVLLPPLVKRDFPNDVGRVTGYYASVQYGVAAISSALAVPIADNLVLGWRLAFGVWAGLALVALGLFLPLIYAAGKSTGTPSLQNDLGLASGTPVARVPWKSARGWAIASYSGLQALFYFAVLAWWPTIESLSGVSQEDAGAHQGIWQVVAIVASLLAGLMLHRLGDDVRPAVYVFAAPSILGVVGQLFLPQLSLLWIVLFGVGIGGTFVVSISLIGLRTVDSLQTAQLSAMVQAVGYSIAAFGPFATGGVAQLFGSWNAALYFLLFLQFVQLAIALFAGKPGHV